MGLIGIDIEGVPELLDRIGPVADGTAYREGIGEVAKHLRNVMMRYPPERHGKMVGGFKSDKQRRYVMMLVRQGKIPYKRTGRLRRNWKILDEGSMSPVVINETDYGGWVQGETQATYHSITGWSTTETVPDKEADRSSRIMARAVEKYLEGRGG